MGIGEADNRQEELYRMSGYVLEVVSDTIEVMVTEGQKQKRLSMPLQPFAKQGILGQDMRFIYRVYRKDGEICSEVLPDDSEIPERPTDQETSKMLGRLEDIQTEARALLGFS